MPLYGLAFGALYAGGGIAIMLSLTAFGLFYLAYPLAAGFKPARVHHGGAHHQ